MFGLTYGHSNLLFSMENLSQIPVADVRGSGTNASHEGNTCEGQ